MDQRSLLGNSESFLLTYLGRLEGVLVGNHDVNDESATSVARVGL